MAQIRHLAIVADNTKELAEFYEDVFEMKIVGNWGEGDQQVYWISDGHMYVALLPNAAVQRTQMYPNTRGLNHFGFTLDPDEKEKVHAKLAARGVELHYPGPDRPYAEEWGLDCAFNRFDIATAKSEDAQIQTDAEGRTISKSSEEMKTEDAA